MKERLLDLLACPTCGGDILLASAVKYDGKEIIEGVLTCKKCTREYRVIRGVPRFADLGKIEVEKAETAENFGWQWTHFTQSDEKYADQLLGWGRFARSSVSKPCCSRLQNPLIPGLLGREPDLHPLYPAEGGNPYS